MLDQKHVKAKDIKSCTYCCYVRCTTLIVQVGGMLWTQTGATHYCAQLGLLDKDCAIKRLVVCYEVLLGFMIYWMGFGQEQAAWVLFLVVGRRMAIKLKCRITP